MPCAASSRYLLLVLKPVYRNLNAHRLARMAPARQEYHHTPKISGESSSPATSIVVFSLPLGSRWLGVVVGI